jgi:hypothetical protein
MIRRALAGAGLIALGACGGGDSKGITDPGGTPGTTKCTVTFSGAKTGSENCVAGAAYSTADKASAISIGVSGSLSGGILIEGEPSKATYTASTPKVTGGVFYIAGVQYWAADSDQGAFTLTISSVGNVVTVPDGKGYTIHGTLDATLPAVAGTGATGTITVHATF